MYNTIITIRLLQRFVLNLNGKSPRGWLFNRGKTTFSRFFIWLSWFTDDGCSGWGSSMQLGCSSYIWLWSARLQKLHIRKENIRDQTLRQNVKTWTKYWQRGLNNMLRLLWWAKTNIWWKEFNRRFSLHDLTCQMERFKHLFYIYFIYLSGKKYHRKQL